MMYGQIAGHLGQDPETRFTPKGQKVTTLRVAVNVRRAKGEKTVWWEVTIWGETFDRLMPYLKKGSAIIAMGDIDTRTYPDREGNTQVGHSLTASYIGFNPFGSGKTDRANADSAESGHDEQPAYAGQTRGAAKPNPASAQFEDDIPF